MLCLSVAMVSTVQKTHESAAHAPQQTVNNNISAWKKNI